jgi:hypothetical protein
MFFSIETPAAARASIAMCYDYYIISKWRTVLLENWDIT